MQVRGMGEGHGQSAHKTTACTHKHMESNIGRKQGGDSSSAGNPSVGNQEAAADHSLSLADMVKKTLNSGTRLLNRIWGGQTAGQQAGQAVESAQEQVMAQLGDPRQSDHSGPREQSPLEPPNSLRAAAAASAVTPQVQQHGYFAPVESEADKEKNLLEMVRVKLDALRGQLTKHFSGRNDFEAKKEQTREDLRKRSRYHGEDEEIDCVLTDDSYLLDSYDRSGGYSKLTTEK